MGSDVLAWKGTGVHLLIDGTHTYNDMQQSL